MRGYEKQRWSLTWTPSFNFLAWSSHFFAGWAVVLTAAHWLGPWPAYAGFLVWAAFKEFVLDALKPRAFYDPGPYPWWTYLYPWGEDDDRWPDGALDFLFYLIGGSIGLILAVL